MIRRKSTYTYLVVFFIVLLAGILRIYAANGLSVDFDEPVYFAIAMDYAQAIKDGDLEGIVAGDVVTVHPLLAKLLFAAVLAPQPQAAPIPEIPPGNMPYERPAVSQFQSLRLTAVLLGIANVLLVALVDPIAAFFLAINTYTIKYTSQVYLEALPMLTSTLAVLAYLRANKKINGWFWLSAVALGVTAAAKYIYCVAGIAIFIDFLWTVIKSGDQHEDDRLSANRGLSALAGWGLLALLSFYVFNPYLWPNPLGRVLESIFGNIHYSQGDHVQNAGLPFYQPFVWLFSSVPWHPTIIFTRLDGLVAVIGVLGIPKAWREKRVMVLWWVVGLIFLLLWSTKWPQYILAITVPVTFCAAAAVRQFGRWLPQLNLVSKKA